MSRFAARDGKHTSCNEVLQIRPGVPPGSSTKATCNYKNFKGITTTKLEPGGIRAGPTRALQQARATGEGGTSSSNSMKGTPMNRTQLMKRIFPKGIPSRQEGKLGYILAWMLGVPIPVLFLIFLLRGCD
jgi:hypothetical protein